MPFNPVILVLGFNPKNQKCSQSMPKVDHVLSAYKYMYIHERMKLC